MRPNPSLNRRANGRPPGPAWRYAVRGTRYIFASPGLASCRCLPVSSNVRQHQMQTRVPPSLPLAFLAIWAVACIFAFLFASEPPVFEFAYFVLPLSAFVVPLCFSHLACRLANRGTSEQVGNTSSIALSAAAAAIGVVAYGLSFSVIARFLELPWRAGKFGGNLHRPRHVCSALLRPGRQPYSTCGICAAQIRSDQLSLRSLCNR